MNITIDRELLGKSIAQEIFDARTEHVSDRDIYYTDVEDNKNYLRRKYQDYFDEIFGEVLSLIDKFAIK